MGLSDSSYSDQCECDDSDIPAMMTLCGNYLSLAYFLLRLYTAKFYIAVFTC